MGTFKVDDLKEDPTMWYLPHFPVIHNDKAPPKVRIVFDAATITNEVCLMMQFIRVQSFKEIYVRY